MWVSPVIQIDCVLLNWMFWFFLFFFSKPNFHFTHFLVWRQRLLKSVSFWQWWRCATRWCQSGRTTRSSTRPHHRMKERLSKGPKDSALFSPPEPRTQSSLMLWAFFLHSYNFVCLEIIIYTYIFLLKTLYSVFWFLVNLKMTIKSLFLNFLVAIKCNWKIL